MSLENFRQSNYLVLGYFPTLLTPSNTDLIDARSAITSYIDNKAIIFADKMF